MVVCDGETCLSPLSGTEPMPWSIDTLVALRDDQVKCEDWPTQIVEGEAVIATETGDELALTNPIKEGVRISPTTKLNIPILFKFVIYLYLKKLLQYSIIYSIKCQTDEMRGLTRKD